MDSPVPHPVANTLSQEEVGKRCVPCRGPANGDAFWQFQLLVDRDTRAASSEGPMPERGGPAKSLAVLHREDPPFDLEICGQWLDGEIDPADWLDLWLGANQITPLSAKRLPTLGGAAGDVIGSWILDQRKWIGRFFCVKAGPRLMLLWFRTVAENYPRLADDWFFSMASFSLTDQSPGPLAEPVRWIKHPSPVPWRLVIPASWEVKLEQGDPGVGAFQSNLMGTGPNGPLVAGKLTFAVVAADRIARPQEAIARALTAAREAGVSLTPAEIIVESATEPRSWISISPMQLGGQSGEVRCRVVKYPAAWAVGAVIAVDRQSSPQAWMRTKRVLDVATSTLEFGS